MIQLITAILYLGIITFSSFQISPLYAVSFSNAERCSFGEISECFRLGVLKYKKGNIAEARQFFTKVCDGEEQKAVLKSGFSNTKREILQRRESFTSKPVNLET